MSASPRSEQRDSMNPRERMQARKRAKADARARQLKQASKAEFHQNKLKAAQNKFAVSGSTSKSGSSANTLSRAASVDVFEDVSMADMTSNEDPSSGTMSEPPFYSSQSMNEYPRAIMTIQELDDESANLQDDEEEEDEIQEEIDELKHTLAEHTMQIEEIKKTILMKRKEQLSDSDDNDDGSDVETLLNEQEQTMRTMRLQQEKKENECKFNQQQNVIGNRQNANKNADGYKSVKSPNNIDVSYNERMNDDDRMDEDEDGDSDESSEEMPIGRLMDRIEFIKRKCVDGMGLEGFKIAYNLMKQLQYEDKDEFVDAINNKIRQLCKTPNVSKSRIEKYRSLIDQLLFIEANCS